MKRANVWNERTDRTEPLFLLITVHMQRCLIKGVLVFVVDTGPKQHSR